MKKVLLSAALIYSMSSFGQEIILGDMNDDGKVTIQDVTECANTVLGVNPITRVKTCDPNKPDNISLAGKWRNISGNVLTLNDDGTASDDKIKEVVAYEYYPYRGDLLLLDQNQYIVKYYHLVRSTSDYIVLSQPGAADLVCYYSKAIPVSNIELSSTSNTLKLGESIQLSATVIPSNAIVPTLKWTSSDNRVATVDDYGNITAKGSGTCVIVAAAIDGSFANACCYITVGVETNGYEAVDLGLSVKWSTMNVGATRAEDTGDCFAWGETEGKYGCTWNNYKFCDGSFNMTKYCVNSSQGVVDNKVIIEAEDDAAQAIWGGDWRMPTYQEFEELINKCTWTWVTNYNSTISGYVIKSNVPGWTDKSIFLPAAGYNGGGNSNYNVGTKGYYWTSTLNTSKSYNANYIYFDYQSNNFHAGERYYGQSVRAVCP